MFTRSKRVLVVAIGVFFVSCTIAGLTAIKIVTRAGGVPSRVVIEGGAVVNGFGAADTESYYAAQRDATENEMTPQDTDFVIEPACATLTFRSGEVMVTDAVSGDSVVVSVTPRTTADLSFVVGPSSLLRYGDKLPAGLLLAPEAVALRIDFDATGKATQRKLLGEVAVDGAMMIVGDADDINSLANEGEDALYERAMEADDNDSEFVSLGGSSGFLICTGSDGCFPVFADFVDDHVTRLWVVFGSMLMESERLPFPL